MGTYMKAVLKDTSEDNIKRCNAEIQAMGYPSEIYEGITYGAFVTMEQFIEDARYMNEDTEGLKQCPHIKRPVTPEFLSRNFFWLTLGHCHNKLSGGGDEDEEELKALLIVGQWIVKNLDKIDLTESMNYRPEFIQSYIYEPA